MTTDAYAKASARYRDFLRGQHPKGSREYREAWRVTKALTVYGARHRELMVWMGTYDSARTLLEHYPQMAPFVGSSSIRSPPRVGDPPEERTVGDAPPEWMAPWMSSVSVFWAERDKKAPTTSDFAKALSQVYNRDTVVKAVEAFSPLYNYIKRANSR